MKIVKMKDVSDEIVDEIIAGKIFVYPTDTIYGIGCNALIEDSVRRIFEIKNRDLNKPLSVIAPNFLWIEENCICDMEKVRKYLPGPYTLILKKFDREFLSVVSSHKETIGVRMIKHPFMEFLDVAGVPFVTTSVNFSGEPHLSRITDMHADVASFVDYAIDDGEIGGRPSKIVDLSDEEEVVVER